MPNPPKKPFDPKDPSTWGAAPGPTEAFTAVGQTAKGLAKAQADRFALTAKTPVYDISGIQWGMPWDKGAFAGTSLPMTSLDPLPKYGAMDYARLGVQLAAMFGGPRGAKNMYNDSYLTGKTVVHGSPTQGLTEINPYTGSNYLPNQRVAYGWDPRAVNNDALTLGMRANEYTGANGSIYVGKAQRGGIVKDDMLGHVISERPFKVVDEIRKSDYPTIDAYSQALGEALMKRGLYPRPNVIGNLREAGQFAKRLLRPDIYHGPV